MGNIPKLCTEEQLLPFFETIGKVVELVIVRDKVSHESKGSAFVWYSSRAHAERAILQFNLRHVLPDPSGEQVREGACMGHHQVQVGQVTHSTALTKQIRSHG